MNGSQIPEDLQTKVNNLLWAIKSDKGELARIQKMSADEYHVYLVNKGFTDDEISLLTQDYAMQAGVQRYPWWLY